MESCVCGRQPWNSSFISSLSSFSSRSSKRSNGNQRSSCGCSGWSEFLAARNLGISEISDLLGSSSTTIWNERLERIYSRCKFRYYMKPLHIFQRLECLLVQRKYWFEWTKIRKTTSWEHSPRTPEWFRESKINQKTNWNQRLEWAARFEPVRNFPYTASTSSLSSQRSERSKRIEWVASRWSTLFENV